MSKTTKGYVSFVLHAHLPFIHHPENENYLEEQWLFEAISETYIPLLKNFQKLVDEKVEGMGFAIPIEYAMSHINSLENKQEIKWPVLGISMANVSDKNTLYRFGLKVPDKLTNGVIVAEVKEGSAAYGQLKVGDIVVKINDKERWLSLGCISKH